jgi:hypothetical protein
VVVVRRWRRRGLPLLFPLISSTLGMGLSNVMTDVLAHSRLMVQSERVGMLRL